MAALFFALMAFLFFVVRGIPVKKEISLCTSKICEEIGNDIIKSMDEKTEPCDDFYKHACGGWIADQYLSRNKTLTRKIHLEKKTLQQLQELLEAVSDSDIEAVRKAKAYYESCLNLGMDKRGLEPLATILKANGEWPLTVPFGKWNLENFSWPEIHEKFARTTGYSALFDLHVHQDSNNDTINMLYLSSPLFVMDDRLKYFQFNHVKYKMYVTNVSQAFSEFRGFKIDDEEFQIDVDEIIFIERQIKNTVDSDVNYRYTTIEELQRTWDTNVKIRASDYSINWLNLIRDRFESTGITIESNATIVVEPGNYFENLATYLMAHAKWNDNSVRMIVNYIHWKAVDSLLEATNNIHWQNKIIPLRKKCILEHKMRNALSYAFIRNYSDGKSRKYALEIAAVVTDALKMDIDKSTWLNKKAREIAKKIINETTKLVGYSCWYEDEKIVNVYYKELTVGSKYFENVIAARLFLIKRRFMKLGQPADRINTESLQPISVWPTYLVQSKTLFIPAGILQSPVFHHENPAVMNFGGFGAMMGHELSHSLDSHFYDRLNQTGQVWANYGIERLKERAKCFVDQYSRYAFTDDYVTGNKITANPVSNLDEHIADNVGFTAALKAYKKFKNDKNIPDIAIPALRNITDEQLFFYSAANTLCDYMKPSYWADFEPGYSPSRARIIGSFSNMKEFSDAFGCTARTYMNPQEKCVFWN